MTHFGTNLKLTIAEGFRPQVRGLFVELFGATARAASPAMDIYTMSDGGCVGVAFVAADQALSERDQAKGAWLEFRVASPDQTATDLARAGVERFELSDRSHHYFQIPGGPVFRLAALRKS